MTQTLQTRQEAPARRRDPAAIDGAHSSVGKSLQILRAFRGAGVLLGVSQVTERAGVPKSTAHRLLAVLVEHGFVEKREGRYMLSRSLFELGNLVADARPRSLREIAKPFMVDLYVATKATVHLAVLDGSDVLYLEKLCGHGTLLLPSRTGGRVPALCTALGKALIAHAAPEELEAALAGPIPRLTTHTVINRTVLKGEFQQIRSQGYAVDQAGSSLAAKCFAAPILDPQGRATAALSVTFPITASVPHEIVNELKRSADGIGRNLNP